jgi:D-3-phosphoglycerate dehydrogenase / 2-oxoglutarate reductase
MKKPIVTITDYVEENLEWEVRQLEDIAELRIFQQRFAEPETLPEILRGAQVAIVNMAKITGRVIRNLPDCRLIIRHGIGYDNVDIRAAADEGIPVINIPDYCIDEVAEQTVMLLLSSARRLPEQMISVESSIGENGWKNASIHRIGRIRGKTVGIVGYGKVGRRVAELCRGFGVRILVNDPYVSSEELPEEVAAVSLKEAAKNSDFLCITAVLNSDTRHLIDRNILGLMKGDAFLINTSRGGVVDQEALAEVLHTGAIAGAATDVYEGAEPPEENNPLLRCPRVIMTPHYSWASVESELDIRKKIVARVREFLLEGKLNGVVNEPAAVNNRHPGKFTLKMKKWLSIQRGQLSRL